MQQRGASIDDQISDPLGTDLSCVDFSRFGGIEIDSYVERSILSDPGGLGSCFLISGVVYLVIGSSWFACWGRLVDQRFMLCFRPVFPEL